MKILYVINHIDWFWSHRLPLAVAAKEAGYEVHVAVPEADDKLSQHGFFGHDLPGSAKAQIPALRKIYQSLQPDIVHAITLKTAFIAGLAGTGLSSIRFVHTIAGLGYLFSPGLQPLVMRLALTPFLKLAFNNAQMVFQNPDDCKLLQTYKIVSKPQCHLIRGSGVDLNQFPYTDEPVKDVPVVVMPTRLVHDKGIAVFIEAAKILQSRNVQAQFQIAGGITHHNPRAISKLEMEDMIKNSPVEWLGKVSDMPALYQTANLIVYPSYYGEGVPKVLLEAASSGRAIATTDHPGCREVVNDGVQGFLVPVRDAEATANAIENLLKNSEQRKAMGIAARKRAEDEFDVNKIAAQTLTVYRG